MQPVQSAWHVEAWALAPDGQKTGVAVMVSQLTAVGVARHVLSLPSLAVPVGAVMYY